MFWQGSLEPDTVVVALISVLPSEENRMNLGRSRSMDLLMRQGSFSHNLASVVHVIWALQG